MLFSSISFLYFFLPILFTAYFIVPQRWRNGILLTASLFFYFYGEPFYIVLLIGSCIWNYFMARCLNQVKAHSRKKIFVLTIGINLAALIFFKYNKQLPLPLGISFFTFQTMSYVIDVYRHKVEVCTKLTDFSTYVCMFPQLVAGPIVRYTDVCNELKCRRHSFKNFSYGVQRFCIGLGKKILLANSFGMLCQLLGNASQPSVLGYWTSAAAFTLQIYFDFGGYSDMAIGLGSMFGFHFPENFNYPLAASSITDFWRRWHITLSSWFREYVYIPLGGSRVSRLKWLRNIAIVWALTGMWHGARANYLLWGLYFAIFLMIEKLWLMPFLKNHRCLAQIYTLLIVIVSFVIFSHEEPSALYQALIGMFGLGSIPLVHPEALYYTRSYGFLIILAFLIALGIPKRIAETIKSPGLCKTLEIVKPLVCIGLLIVSTAFLIDASFNPFLYFRF